MSLKLEQVKNELVRYLGTQPQFLQGAILSKEVLLNRYARTITKVKGHYPTVQALMSNVVQIFDSKKFTPYGDITFIPKVLINHHQKIDFELDPAEILGSWFEDMYDESTGVKDKSISRLAVDMLKKKIIDDVNWLSISGKFDASQKGQANPTFGTSMNGLNEIHKKIDADTDNPVFHIPGDALTSANILDVVQNYEKKLPSQMKSKLVNNDALMLRKVKAQLLALELIEHREDNKITLTTKGLKAKNIKQAGKKPWNWEVIIGVISIIVTILIALLSYYS